MLYENASTGRAHDKGRARRHSPSCPPLFGSSSGLNSSCRLETRLPLALGPSLRPARRSSAQTPRASAMPTAFPANSSSLPPSLWAATRKMPPRTPGGLQIARPLFPRAPAIFTTPRAPPLPCPTECGLNARIPSRSPLQQTESRLLLAPAQETRDAHDHWE
jgi:hypothetical protein